MVLWTLNGGGTSVLLLLVVACSTASLATKVPDLEGLEYFVEGKLYHSKLCDVFWQFSACVCLCNHRLVGAFFSRQH
jgi:hypothetical protein